MKKRITIILFALILVTTVILAVWKIESGHQNIVDSDVAKLQSLFDIVLILCVIQMLVCELDIMYDIYYYFFIPKDNDTKTTLNGILFIVSLIILAVLISFVFLEKFVIQIEIYLFLIAVYYIMRISCFFVKTKDTNECNMK